MKMRPLAILATAAAALIPIALANAQTAPPPSGAVVRIANFTFTPPVLAIRPGTTVTWINDDDIPHTVVANDHTFRSQVLDTGDRFSFTFAKPGQFGYFCSLHPHMTGRIAVKP